MSGFAVAELPARLGLAEVPALRTVVDRDFYLIAPRTANVKVRDRTSTLKVKTLLDAEADGFELWRTEAETPLPAPPEAWAQALGYAGTEADPDTEPDLGLLASTTTAQESASALARRLAAGSVIEVIKRRRAFDIGTARLETAEVSIGDWVRRSVSFESADLKAVRRLRERFDTSGLGPPTNYVDMLPYTPQ